MSGRLRTLAEDAGDDPERLVEAFLTVREVFGEDLAADPRLRETLRQALGRLLAVGAAAAVAERA